MMCKKDIEWLLSHHQKENQELLARLSDKEISYEEYEESYLIHLGAIMACKFILQID